MAREKDITRFLKYVPSSEVNSCWIWSGGRNKAGYGAFNVSGNRIDAHRFAYLAFKGSIPPGYFVCHTCDTPACVNPDHLFEGTAFDNMRDASRKGRVVLPPPRPRKPRKSRRIANPNTKPGAKITPEIAKDIKLRLASGETGRSIAHRYDIHFASVSDIKRGLTWKDI